MANELADAIRRYIAYYNPQTSDSIGFPLDSICKFLSGAVDVTRRDAAKECSRFELSLRLSNLTRSQEGWVVDTDAETWIRHQTVDCVDALRRLLSKHTQDAYEKLTKHHTASKALVLEGVEFGGRQAESCERGKPVIGGYMTADFDIDNELLWVKKWAESVKDSQKVIDSVWPVCKLWCVVFKHLMMEAFGFGHFLCVYSGKRGLSCARTR